MLITSKKILEDAKKNGYAIPAPDYIDLDSARAYVHVAQKLQKPIILSYAQAHQEVLSLDEAAVIGKLIAEQAIVPVVLHLDHGTDEEFIKKAIALGFTSVMIDASMESYEVNVERTKRIVAYAHAHGVVVEAEIGHVGSGVNYENHDHSDSIYTDVDDAIAFVKETNVDSLAVSIGTAHGVYKGKPVLSFERLHELQNALNIPLVLHGGSGSGFENLHRCAIEGISKINVFTDFLIGAMDEINAQSPKDYIDLKKAANKGMEKVLEQYYQVFSQEGYSK